MKLNTLHLLFFIFSGFAPGCNDSDGSSAQKNSRKDTLVKTVFDRLTGTWQNENGKSFEHWTNNGNGTYQVEAFSIKGTDTSWNEQAEIYMEKNNWVFENTVKGQNDGKAIKFTSSHFNENSVQFSNPAHDFPTDINYSLSDANTLRAFIAGPNDKGGKDTIPFYFKRVQ